MTPLSPTDSFREFRNPDACPSNSRPGDTFVADDTGIDTVRFRFRQTCDARDRFFQVPHRIDKHGDPYVQLCGVRFACTRAGMVSAEGRLAAMLDGPTAHRLCRQTELREGSLALREQLDELGIDAGDHVSLGRLDLAGELRFEDPSKGAALLRVAGLLDLPWAKTGTDGRKAGNVESISFRSVRGHKILGRFYDKGVESGSDGPGQRVRYERQIRWQKAQEPSLEEALRFRLGDLYAKQLRAFRGERDLLVAPTLAAADALWQMQRSGQIGWQQAERLAGYVTFRASGQTEGLSDRTRQRRERELRQLGLVIADEGTDGTHTVPFGQYLEAFADAWDRGPR